MLFNEMNLIAPLVSSVQHSGYRTPTPIQEKTIPLVLSGRDVLGCAQTGTGKTAAFVLPILQRIANDKAASGDFSSRRIRALVLAPTRELALQNFEAFELFGKGLAVRSAVVFGGVNQNPQVDALKRGVDVLVATPGRLNDLIHQGFIKLGKLDVFVLDEADRMLDMGFIHDVRAVIALLPERRQTLLFSATMPKEVEELALSLLRDPATVKISPVTSTVDKIEQTVYLVPKDNKRDALLWLLQSGGVSSALVFTRTKHEADRIARILTKNRIKTMAIHGDKSQNARQAALSAFKEGKISVLVATDIAARGIDIIELPFVVNYNIPEEAETYIHRIGRTGRAGLGGTAISLCCSDELADWRAIEKLTGKPVPVSACAWSVAEMQPTVAVRRSGGQRSVPRPQKQPPQQKQAQQKPQKQPQPQQNAAAGPQPARGRRSRRRG